MSVKVPLPGLKITGRDVTAALGGTVTALIAATVFWLNQTYARPSFVRQEDEAIVKNMTVLVREQGATNQNAIGKLAAEVTAQFRPLEGLPERVRVLEVDFGHFSTFATEHEKEQQRTTELLAGLRADLAAMKARQDEHNETSRQLIDAIHDLRQELAQAHPKKD